MSRFAHEHVIKNVFIDHWVKPALLIVLIGLMHACLCVWNMEGPFSPQSSFELENGFPEIGVEPWQITLENGSTHPQP